MVAAGGKLVWFPQHLPEITGALGITAGAFLSFDDTRIIGVCLSVLAVGALLISIILTVRKARYNKNAAEAVSSTIVEASDAQEVLKNLAGEMNVLHPWRITLYEVDRDQWRRLGRRSSLPEYQNEGGRLHFHLDSGCIGRALRTGAIEEMLALPNPKHDFDGWVRAHGEWRVAPRDAEKLRMRSQSYTSVVHEIPFGPFAGVHVGVVVESEEAFGTSRASVDRAFPLEVVAMLHKLAKIGPESQRLRAIVTDHIGGRR